MNYDDISYRLAAPSDSYMSKLFSDDSISQISKVITEKSRDRNTFAYPVVVPDHIIRNVLNEVADNYSLTKVGTDPVREITNKAVWAILDDVSYNLGMERKAANYSAWDTVLGTFNRRGLQSHPQIKIREGGPRNRGKVSFMTY